MHCAHQSWGKASDFQFSQCCGMLGYTGASTPLYPPQRYRAWSGWSQPKALGHHRLKLRARTGPAQLWEWRMSPHPGIFSQESAPELWVLRCPAKSERGSGCTEKTVQRKPPLSLRDFFSSSTAVRELHPQIRSHMLVPQATAPGSHPLR